MEINGKRLCDSCFEEIEEAPCPYCGYAAASYKTPVGILPVGSVLKGRYQIGKVLGKGGFGVTYKAYDLETKGDPLVAVKEYYPSGMAHRDTGTTQVSVSEESLENDFRSGAEKFFEEAKTISRFNGNPNIVGVYDYFQENGTAYFIMEYLDGMDLKHYIALMGGKLTQENVVHIARVVSDALLITHSMNVLHRDISPDNIYITGDGRIKLIDFGAARQVMSQQSKSMSVILKQGFAPLEQYQRKGKQGAWTDIYALGATMYYALTGKIPDDATERIEEPEIGRAEDYGVDPELWAVIDKCMAVKVSDRYAETVDFKRALNKQPIQEAELAGIPNAQPQMQQSVPPQPECAQPQMSQPAPALAQPVPAQEDEGKTVAFGGDATGAVQQPAQAYEAQPSMQQSVQPQQQGYTQSQQSQPAPALAQPVPAQADEGKTVAFGGDATGAVQQPAQAYEAQPSMQQSMQSVQPQPEYAQPQMQAFAQADEQPRQGEAQPIWKSLLSKSKSRNYVGMIVSVIGLVSCLLTKMVYLGGYTLNERIDFFKLRYPIAVLFGLALLCFIFKLNWIAFLPAAAALGFVCYYLQPHEIRGGGVLFINYWYWGMLFAAFLLPVMIFAVQGKLLARREKTELKRLRYLGLLTAAAGSFLAGHGSLAAEHAYLSSELRIRVSWKWRPIPYQMAIVLVFLLAAVLLCTKLYYTAGAAAAVSLVLICKDNAYVIAYGYGRDLETLHRILYGLMTPVAIALTALSVILAIAKIVIAIKKAGSKKAVNG